MNGRNQSLMESICMGRRRPRACPTEARAWFEIFLACLTYEWSLACWCRSRCICASISLQLLQLACTPDQHLWWKHCSTSRYRRPPFLIAGCCDPRKRSYVSDQKSRATTRCNYVSSNRNHVDIRIYLKVFI